MKTNAKAHCERFEAIEVEGRATMKTDLYMQKNISGFAAPAVSSVTNGFPYEPHKSLNMCQLKGADVFVERRVHLTDCGDFRNRTFSELRISTVIMDYNA